MAKNLDGIKKLNPEDIKKYRKIVLNYIGEKDATGVNERKNSSQVIFRSRKVDGVNINKVNRLAAKSKIRSLKPSAGDNSPLVSPAPLTPRSSEPIARPVELTGSLGGNKAELAKSMQLEEERLQEAIKRQEEERKKIKAEERQYQLKQERAEQDRRDQIESQLQEKVRLEKERIRQEENKQQERRRAAEVKKWAEKMKLAELEEAERRRVGENIRLEKMRRREEIARIKEAMKIKKQAIREKKIIKRQKAWRKINKNFNFKLKIFLLKVKQNLIYIISLAILFLAIAYIVFCLAVLRFNNNFTGWAANYLPVPAAITSQGIISYSDYRKIENKNYLNLSLAEKKNYLAEWVVLRDLKKKYRLPAESANDALAIKYVLDKDFNQIGLSRINKIDELLNDKSEFEQLGKYADEFSDGAYYDQKSALVKFGSTVLELASGQISNIIPRADGYYIVERINDKKNQLGLKYIFIKALTLDQYVNRQIGKVKVFILAN